MTKRKTNTLKYARGIFEENRAIPAITVSAHRLDSTFVLVDSKTKEQHPYYIESRYKRSQKRSLASRTEIIVTDVT